MRGKRARELRRIAAKLSEGEKNSLMVAEKNVYEPSLKKTVKRRIYFWEGPRALYRRMKRAWTRRMA